MKSTLNLKVSCFFLFIFFNAFYANAQFYKKNWYFGNGTDGLVFDENNNPVKVSNKYNQVGFEGVVNVSDPLSGQLMFYSDGLKVINKNHAIMTGGSALLGALSCAQAAQSCPVPGSCFKKFYLFYNAGYDFVAGNYYYAIIDFTLDPLGVVTFANTVVNSGTTDEANCLVNKPGTNDFWLILSVANSASYKVYPITSSGIGAPLTYTFTQSGWGYQMNYSSVNQKIVTTGRSGNKQVTLLDFDPLTGVLSNEVQLWTGALTTAYGARFSPDATKLYVGINPPSSGLFQYDFTIGVWTNMSTCCHAHDLEIGPDGKMYHIRTYNVAQPIAVINFPNASAIGNACGYTNLVFPTPFNGQVRRFPEFLVLPSPPTALSDTFIVQTGIPTSLNVLQNDSDPQDDIIIIDSILSGPFIGTAFISGGEIVYNSNAPCGTEDSLVYRIIDENCAYDTAVVFFKVMNYVDFQIIIDTNCNSNVTFQNLSLTGSSNFWNFGDGDTSSVFSPTHGFNSAGTFTVTLISEMNSCIDTVQLTFTLDSTIQADMLVTQVNCDLLVNFEGSSLNATSSYWDFGDGNSDTTMITSHVYSNPGLYSVFYAISSGICADTAFQTILVQDTVDADFISSFDCDLQGMFTNISTGSVANLWNFGDGIIDTSLSPLHSYALPGVYTVTLICGQGNCSDTLSKNITVYEKPSASFEVENICGLPAKFFAQDSIDREYYWDFGDGMIDTSFSPVHLFANPGTYSVTLICRNGICADTLSKLITVYESPNASFLFENVCGFTSRFFAASSTNSEYFWDFGDGNYSTLMEPLHDYDTIGTYFVKLILNSNNGCIDSSEIKLEHKESFNTSFTFSSQTCQQNKYFFKNESIGGKEYRWMINNEVVSELYEMDYTFKTAGVYLIRLIMDPNSICADTIGLDLRYEVSNDNHIHVPNFFTPDDDGINDLFVVNREIDCGPFEISIFNRWGQLVHKSDGDEIVWDGNLKEGIVANGTYFYILLIKDALRLTGTISVIY